MEVCFLKVLKINDVEEGLEVGRCRKECVDLVRFSWVIRDDFVRVCEASFYFIIVL